MATLQYPAPCPVARVGSRNSQKQCSLLSGEMRGMQNVKPRRPRTGKSTIGWDPTTDIYDESLEIHRSEGTTAAELKPEASATNPRAEKPSRPSRRSSFFMQPPQRLAFDAAGVDLTTKRRKISTLPEVDETCAINVLPVIEAKPSEKRLDPPQHIARAPRRSTIHKNISRTDEGDTTRMLRPFEKTSRAHVQEETKDPRRRTIIIPSEDTTIYTIHPGNSLRAKEGEGEKVSRSGVFLGITEAATENWNAQTPVATQLRRPARRSLAVAASRGPLQSSTRQMQPNSCLGDRYGVGDGKENIPPGGVLKPVKSQFSHDSTLDIDLTSMHASGFVGHRSLRTSIPPNETKGPSNNTTKQKCAVASTTEASAGSFKSASQLVSESTTLRASRQSISSGLSFVKSTSSNLCRNDNRKAPSVTRKNTVPSDQYPVLSEDISAPSLFEDNWLNHQETALTQILNELLVNAGNDLSNNASTATNDELRAELLTIYQDPAHVLLYKRLQASVQFGGLSLPKETLAAVSRFRDDIAQRQRFLDLWLKTYQLDYLQSTAEAVIGRKIDTVSRLSGTPPKIGSVGSHRLKAKSMEAFLKTCLVNNEDCLNISSDLIPLDSAESGHKFGEDIGSAAWRWRRTIVRSLMLVLLLDKAKESGLLKGCLFQPSSPFKSSSAVLQALSMLLLPSIGDTARVLGHLNYQLSHVQLPLHEHSYLVRNLAVDLRDGVVLTRLAETLLYPQSSNMPVKQSDETVVLPSGETLSLVAGVGQEESWKLSQHLKYPCTSRITKIYNVQIFLSALAGTKDIGTMLDGILPDDIVDGHREKTVGLLWSLVSRWGLLSLVNFDIVDREIARLAATHRRRDRGAVRQGIKDSNDCAVQINQGRYSGEYVDKLQSWAQSVCDLHGIAITNLSTSYADGSAYSALICEYGAYLSANMARESQAAIESRTSTVTTTLRSLGCSKAFVALFESTSTILTHETTIPLLAFLASRLLPIAQPRIAGLTIRRAWRHYTARRDLHRRVKLAVLAQEAAVVVGLKEKMCRAAVTIQRTWRAYSCRS